jgi:nucleoside-diphosphate-sugar epimerase
MEVLLTGGSGFLGIQLKKEIKNQVNLFTIGRKATNDIVADFTNRIENLPQFDAIIHAAGLAHNYPKNEKESEEFYNINVKGTQNLLEGLKNQKIKVFFFISTVAVYGIEKGTEIDEQAPLLGCSPYAKSKILAEELVINWCNKNNINYLILRLPLVVGPNPPGNLGKMIKAIQKGIYFSIGQGTARKSIVHSNDIALLIKEILQNTNFNSGIYNLTDGRHPHFFEVENVIKKAFHKSRIFTLPRWTAKLLGYFGDLLWFFPINSETFSKLTNDLTFNDSKARKELNWNPRNALENLFV